MTNERYKLAWKVKVEELTGLLSLTFTERLRAAWKAWNTRTIALEKPPVYLFAYSGGELLTLIERFTPIGDSYPRVVQVSGAVVWPDDDKAGE